MGGEHRDKHRHWRLIGYIVVSVGVFLLVIVARDEDLLHGFSRIEILRPILGALFAAFCVWLTVRIISRREQWAINIAALLIVFGGMLMAGLAILFW